jgi:hypothetical protein
MGHLAYPWAANTDNYVMRVQGGPFFGCLYYRNLTERPLILESAVAHARACGKGLLLLHTVAHSQKMLRCVRPQFLSSSPCMRARVDPPPPPLRPRRQPCPKDAAGFERHEAADNALFLIERGVPSEAILEESASLETVR